MQQSHLLLRLNRTFCRLSAAERIYVLVGPACVRVNHFLPQLLETDTVKETVRTAVSADNVDREKRSGLASKV